MSGRWPLLEAYPSLAAVLSPATLCELPTPVEPLPALGPRAWVKRDDVTAQVYGGNKMRKLEVIVPELARHGARHVVTFGGTGTNAGVATSIVAEQLGIGCTVLLFSQPPSSTVEKNRARMQQHGAVLRRTGGLFSTALAFYAHPRRLDPRTYFLFAGCSNPVSVFAYVNAAFELRAQIDAQQCPEPAEIVVAAGTCATLAGLTLGCALAGLHSRVIGVRVAPAHVGGVASCTVDVTRRLMEHCATRLAALADGPRSIVVPAPVLLDDYYGDGYGVATDAGARAVARMHDATGGAVPLEQTYTGKAFAAFLDRVDDGGDRPLLFWNTFSSR